MKKYTLNVKGLTLNDFATDTYIRKPNYSYQKEETVTDYIYEKDGFTIMVTKFYGNIPWAVCVKGPNGFSANAMGYNSPEEALDYLLNLEGLNEAFETELIA